MTHPENQFNIYGISQVDQPINKLESKEESASRSMQTTKQFAGRSSTQSKFYNSQGQLTKKRINLEKVFGS